MKVADFFSKKTKIVCTIGPASQSQAVLERMISKGMDVARINFAHGDLDGHRQTIAHVRAAAEAVGRRVAIFGDLPGPKMRIGRLEEEPIYLERGQSFSLLTEDLVGDATCASMSFKELPRVVMPGNNIFVNDGLIQLAVEEVTSDAVHCQVLSGGEMRSHKGVNLPDIELGICAFTDQDHEFLRFAAAEGIDGLSQSFVEAASDIEAVREAAVELDYDPFIIAKIERSQALANLEEIIEVADGIMVARGDLGVEIPIQRIATTQKRIISLANLSGKPVITATHMLESMVHNPRPTRAEATDVANAILDGTDCVMLSGETAVGDYPDEAVSVMNQIALETENYADDFGVADLLQLQKASGEIARDNLIAFDIYVTAKTLKPALVFVPSATGSTARRVSRFRLKQWIVAVCLDERSAQKLHFSYGVYPQYVRENPESWNQYAHQWLQERGMDGDLVLVIQGGNTVRDGDTTRLDIIDLS